MINTSHLIGILGLVRTTDPHSFEPIPWKGISLEVGKMKDSEMYKELERHSKDLRVKVMNDETDRRTNTERLRDNPFECISVRP